MGYKAGPHRTCTFYKWQIVGILKYLRKIGKSPTKRTFVDLRWRAVATLCPASGPESVDTCTRRKITNVLTRNTMWYVVNTQKNLLQFFV